MLHQIITTKPFPKFVLIQDTYENKQTQLLQWILRNHITKNSDCTCFVYFFENDIKPEANPPGVQTYYYPLNVLHKDNHEVPEIMPCFLSGDLEFEIEFRKLKAIIVIDSLADLILEYGLAYSINNIRKLIENESILQIVAVLHTDLFENDKISKQLSFISPLNITAVDKDVVEYTYKRMNSKVSKKVVKLIFNSSKELFCQEIDLKKFKQPVTEEPTLKPDELSTFKISLKDNEVEARKKLVLPYLKNEELKGKPNITIGNTSGGKIIYLPDENDDFDEEDPDDDLNI